MSDPTTPGDSLQQTGTNVAFKDQVNAQAKKIAGTVSEQAIGPSKHHRSLARSTRSNRVRR